VVVGREKLVNAMSLVLYIRMKLPSIPLEQRQGRQVGSEGGREGGREGGTNGSGVLGAREHDLRRPVPPRHHVFG